MTRRIKYLSRRGQVYQIRIPIPKGLQNRIGRRELRWSLYTKDKRTAEIRTWNAAVKFFDLCDSIRVMPQLTNMQIQKLVQQFFSELKDTVQPMTARSPIDAQHYREQQEILSDDAIGEWRTELFTRSFSPATRESSKRLLERTNKNSDLITPVMLDRLHEGIVRAQIEFQNYVIQQSKDQFKEYEPIDPLFRLISDKNPDSPKIETPPADASNPLDVERSIGSLADEFIARGIELGFDDGTPWKAASISRYKRALPWFVEYVGGSSSVATVNKNHVKSIRDLIQARPKSLPSNTSIHDFPTAEPGLNRVSSTTARNEFAAIQKFLRWCSSEGHIAHELANVTGIPKAKVTETKKKRPMDLAEINRLFSSPLFAGNRSAKFPHREGPLISKSEMYWAFLLLHFTGARVSDLAALRSTDVMLDHSVPHLQFRMRYGELKEAASERDTPIHPDLFQFGLSQFVQKRQQNQPDDFLFGKWKREQDLRETMVTKLIRYLRRIGITDRRVGTHSFRHGVISAFRNSGCHEATAERFVGHKVSTVHANYGTQLSLEAQLKALKKVDFLLNDETRDILMKAPTF